MTRKRARKDEPTTTRVRKSRTGKKAKPEEVSDYMIDLCGGSVPGSAKMVEQLTGIPANLDAVNDAENQERHSLHHAVGELKEKRRRKNRRPEFEIQGSLATREKREKFIKCFEDIHRSKGYAPSGEIPTYDLNPLLYDNPTGMALPSRPTLQNVDPLACLAPDAADRLSLSPVYQEIEIIIRPYRKKEFVLSTARKMLLDRAGWMLCPEAIEPDERFVSEFFVSRDGLWGLYIMQHPQEELPGAAPVTHDAELGLKVAYYVYVARQGKSNA